MEKPSKEDKRKCCPRRGKKNFKAERGLGCENTVENSPERRIFS